MKPCENHKGLLNVHLFVSTAMTENATPATDSINTPSKYSIGSASRQGRLNKEASQMRGRVQQLLEAVAAQQQKRGRKSSDSATKAVCNSSSANNSNSNSTAAGMAALFVRKNLGVASLFSSSTTVALNARHLRMNRQLTVSWECVRVVYGSGVEVHVSIWPSVLSIASRPNKGFVSDVSTYPSIRFVLLITISAIHLLE